MFEAVEFSALVTRVRPGDPLVTLTMSEYCVVTLVVFDLPMLTVALTS